MSTSRDPLEDDAQNIWRLAAKATGDRPYGPVELGELDQPLLRQLTDLELRTLKGAASELAQQLDEQGDERVATYIRATLWVVIHNRQGELRERLNTVRVMLDANGHEAWLSHDDVKHDQDGHGWIADCSCGNSGTPWRATRQEARDDGAAHLGDHGGRWNDQLSD